VIVSEGIWRDFGLSGEGFTWKMAVKTVCVREDTPVLSHSKHRRGMRRNDILNNGLLLHTPHDVFNTYIYECHGLKKV